MHACILLAMCIDAITHPLLTKRGCMTQLWGSSCALRLQAYLLSFRRAQDIADFSFVQVTECLSAIFAGAAFDGLHLSATKVVLIMAGVSAVIAVAWVAYAVSQWPRGSKDADQPPEQDQEELLPSVSL